MTEKKTPAKGETGDQIVDRASVGARLLTARGFGMRIISVASTFALVAMVRPADLGLLAVVRGLTALAGSTTELGFAWALLRREQDPSREEYAALAGVQLSIVTLWLAIAALFPALLIEIASVPAEWYPWMMAVLVTTLLIPFGTNAKIRVERSLDYRKVAFYDVSSVLLLNVTLLGFAVAGHFTAGVFVATAAMIIYTNSLLWFWSPGPMPSFRLGPWRRLAGDFAGFSAAHLCFVLYQSATPVVVANLFGLATAGIWSFATRLGNVLQVAFEGFRRASVPAAARLTRDAAALRRLAEESLVGTARLTIPMTAGMIAGLPVIAWLWPQWQPAVEVGQIYVLGYGLSGMFSASVTPVAVAVRGSRVALGEQLAPMAVGWVGFLLLDLVGSGAIGWVIVPMFVALAVTTWKLTPAGLRPGWSPRIGRNLVALLAAIAVTIAGRGLQLHPMVTVIVAGLAFLAIGWRVLLPVRPSRVAARAAAAEPSVAGVASEPG